MRFLRYLHTGYGFAVFTLLFVIFFFPLLVPVFFPSRHRWVGFLNRAWAKAMFFLIGLPVRLRGVEGLSRTQHYIFCPNHFSYLDIPTMGLTPVNCIFVGKNDMENIPLFGFMYRKLHITVDRERLKSRYETYVKSRQALDEGKSLIIYPEGGIYTMHPPELVRFKDGAFRLAIEKQIPIVPVTIPNNWILLPPDEFLLRAGRVEIVYHDPIPTSLMTMADLPALKEKVFNIIRQELEKK